MKKKLKYDKILLEVTNMTIVFKVSDNIKEKMIEYYQDKRKEKTPPYAIFQAVEADTVITLYESGKAMFQGISADIDANMWRDLEKHFNGIDVDTRSTEEKKEASIDKTNYYFNAIGSDEVGTGDYFLPIVVTATFITKDDLNFLEQLGVHDSKKLTDEKIKRCAPLIIKRIMRFTIRNCMRLFLITKLLQISKQPKLFYDPSAEKQHLLQSRHTIIPCMKIRQLGHIQQRFESRHSGTVKSNSRIPFHSFHSHFECKTIRKSPSLGQHTFIWNIHYNSSPLTQKITSKPIVMSPINLPIGREHKTSAPK